MALSAFAAEQEFVLAEIDAPRDVPLLLSHTHSLGKTCYKLRKSYNAPRCSYPLSRFACSFSRKRSVCLEDSEQQSQTDCFFAYSHPMPTRRQLKRLHNYLFFNFRAMAVCVQRPSVHSATAIREAPTALCALYWMFLCACDYATVLVMEKLLQNMRMTFYKAGLSTSSGCRVCHP